MVLVLVYQCVLEQLKLKMNCSKIYITGSSGFSEEVAFAVKRTYGNKINIIFIENNKNTIGTVSSSGIEKILENILKKIKDPNVLITISDPLIRKQIVLKYKEFNKYVNFPNFLDSSLILENKSLEIGIGNIILHNTIITTNVFIGDFNIINSYSGIGHNTKIGSYNTFNPRVAISGNVSVGNQNIFGMNSGILQNKNILDNNSIWINSIITRNYKSGNTLFGVPAKKILI